MENDGFDEAVASILDTPSLDADLIEEEPVQEPEPSPCLWCERAREFLFGVAAVGIGIIFLYIGVDLATNGALSARFFGREDDSITADAD